jgi:hypothetical protein
LTNANDRTNGSKDTLCKRAEELANDVSLSNWLRTVFKSSSLLSRSAHNEDGKATGFETS